MTQVQLAARAGLRHATIVAIETGKTKGIDFDTLERLAHALDVDPQSLIVSEPLRLSVMREKYPSQDMAVHAWLNRLGLIVVNEESDFDRDALIWYVVDGAGANRHSLRITENVLLDVTPETLVAVLDLYGAGAVLKSDDLIVKQRPNRNLIVERFRAADVEARP